MVRAVSEHELPEYARQVLTDAAKQSGYPLVAVERDGIGYDSQVAMARRGQPFHLLAFVPQYRQFSLHFIVNAAWKIKRFFDLPPSERLVPTTKQVRRLPKRLEDELRKKLGNPPEPALRGLSSFLYEGTVRQLTSMPIDIRVERELAEQLPEHQAYQSAYLARQVEDLEPHFMPEVAQVSPRKIYAASSAMNVALAQEAADIADVTPGPMFRQTPHKERGHRLRTILHSIDEPGYRGDRLATDLWASELGLKDWYDWQRLEAVK